MIAQDERDATIAALKPPKRQRPLIAIIGINDATETTDYLMPYGILTRADVADVVTLATRPGPVTLYPALKVEPQATVAEFDAQHPDGADYVIVPAMSRDDDPVGAAMDEEPVGQGRDRSSASASAPRWSAMPGCCMASGRPPTGTPSRKCAEASHDALCRRPAAGGRWRRGDDDRHHRVDADVADADRGHCRTRQGGRRRPGIGLTDWDARHESDAFKFTRPFALTAIGNTAAFWAQSGSASSSSPASTKYRSRWWPTRGRGPIGHRR